MIYFWFLLQFIIIMIYSTSALLFGEVLARIGCKRTGALGTILVVAGYGGGALCHSVPGLCLTIGLLAGKLVLKSLKTN